MKTILQIYPKHEYLKYRLCFCYILVCYVCLFHCHGCGGRIGGMNECTFAKKLNMTRKLQKLSRIVNDKAINIKSCIWTKCRFKADWPIDRIIILELFLQLKLYQHIWQAEYLLVLLRLVMMYKMLLHTLA